MSRYVRDGKITDFNELFDLSERKQPVIWVAGLVPHDFVKPAAFFLQWPLAKLKCAQLYKAKKVENETQSIRKQQSR